MNTSVLPLKRLRYKPLTHLLGRKVTIARVAETESAVLRELNAGLAKTCRLQDPARELALIFSKYGFLDITLAAPIQLLNRADRPRRSTLRDLGFIGAEEDRSCLETLIEGIDESKCWLRLFLFGEPAMDAIKRIFEEYKRYPHPVSQPATMESTMFRMEKAVSRLADSADRRLPMTFTIQDACLTNSDAIWLASHAYL